MPKCSYLGVSCYSLSTMKVIGVDVGGTFTDVILVDSKTGMQYVHKVPSVPNNQDIAVIKGIEEVLANNSLERDDVNLVVHGTTVATNAMLERKGAKVVLLTTAGLEDVLEIGRQQREDIYALTASRPESLVSRENRIGVDERIDAQGNTLLPLDQDEALRVSLEAMNQKPEAVAISLLFSYTNSKHERILRQAFQNQKGVYVAISSDVLPEFREFERTSTTVLEAYLGPLVIGYLEKLDASLQDLVPTSHLTVMQSNGGTALASQTRGRTIGLAISGLAGGVIGGWEIAKQNKINKALTLDMGGTSCDISAIIGDIIVRPDNEIAGLPLRMPSVDVKTIGAGGGSIAWIDAAGILHVGPQSAGAVPGPASYDKGGRDPTVTDANLLLGRLNPAFFLGGNIELNTDLAKQSMAEIAIQLNLSIKETTLGILRISTENMVQAIREVTIERGSDPRDFVLIPFGGAGPTQSIDIAESLGINKILIPPHPGITSAFGLVCSNLRVDLMKTILVEASQSNVPILIKTLNELSIDAEKELSDQGVSKTDVRLDWKIDMRYVGQSHELAVPLNTNENNLLNSSVNLFETLHRESFGYQMKGRQVEWVTARVSAIAKSHRSMENNWSVQKQGTPIATREIFLSNGETAVAQVFRRGELGEGQEIKGPAIIEQIDTTTYISPEWTGQQQSNGCLWLRRKS